MLYMGLILPWFVPLIGRGDCNGSALLDYLSVPLGQSILFVGHINRLPHTAVHMGLGSGIVVVGLVWPVLGL